TVVHPTVTSAATPTQTLRQIIDRLGKLDVPLGHVACIMAGQPEIDAVPHAGELGVMIDLLGVQRDPGQEAERLAEILELECPDQRLAAGLERPCFWRIHRHLSAVNASPADSSDSLEMLFAKEQLAAKGD